MQATPLWCLVITPCGISQQLERRKKRRRRTAGEQGFVERGWRGFDRDWERWSRKKCSVVVQESKTGQRQVAQLHQNSLLQKCTTPAHHELESTFIVVILIFHRSVFCRKWRRTHSRLPMLSRSPVPGKKLSPYLWKDTVMTLLVVRNASSTPSPW